MMSPSSSSSSSIPDYSLCVVCNLEFDSNSMSPTTITTTKKCSKRKNSKITEVGYRRMLKIFHKYLYFHLLTPNHHKIKSNYSNCTKSNIYEDTEESDNFTSCCDVDGIPLPFCHNCRTVVSQLCDLHMSLESIQQNIKKTIAQLSSTIVQTERVIKMENGSKNLVKTTRKLRTAQYRKRILQNLNPQIPLTDCLSSLSTNKNKNIDENNENMGIVINATWTQKNNNSNSKRKLVTNDSSSMKNNRDNNDDFEVDGGDVHLHNDADDYSDMDFMTMFTDTSMPQSNENEDEDYNIDDDDLRVSEGEEEKAKKGRNSTQKKKRGRKKKIKPENGETIIRRKYKKRTMGVKKPPKEKSRSITFNGFGTLLYKEKWPFKKSDNGFICSICTEFHANIPLIKIHMEEAHSQIDPSQIQIQPEEREEEEMSQEQIQNFNHIRTLEETLLKDFPSTNKKIAKIGNGEFLYNDNWMFYLHPDGDSFICQACGVCHPASQKGGSQIACNIVKHIKKRHIAVGSSTETPMENINPGSDTTATTTTSNNEFGRDYKKIGTWSKEISPGHFMWGKWPFTRIDGGYLCGTCPAIRIQRNKMTSHIRIVHENYKAFICEICGIGHNSRSLLKIHQASHSNEKQFICEICARPYKEKTGLIIHRKRVHNLTSNSKPKYTYEKHSNSSLAVTCEKCGKSYSTSVRLYNHLKICGIVREKVYQPYKPRPKPNERVACPLCNKTYADNRVLAIHLDRHNNVQRHFCDVCNRGFLHKWQMTKHKSEEHSDLGPSATVKIQEEAL